MSNLRLSFKVINVMFVGSKYTRLLTLKLTLLWLTVKVVNVFRTKREDNW